MGMGIATSPSSGTGKRIGGGSLILGMVMYWSSGSKVLLPLFLSSAIFFCFGREKGEIGGGFELTSWSENEVGVILSAIRW